MSSLAPDYLALVDGLERALDRSAVPDPRIVVVNVGAAAPPAVARPGAPFVAAGGEAAIATLAEEHGAVRLAAGFVMDGDVRVPGFAARLAGALLGGARVDADGDALRLGAEGASARRIAL